MAVSATALLSLLALKGHAASSIDAAAYPRVEDIATPVTRLAFGSCNDQSMEQPLWKHIIEYAPEMWLWMGDNVRASLSAAVRLLDRLIDGRCDCVCNRSTRT